MRAKLNDDQRFDRQAALIAAAAELDLDIYKLDDVLFCDLKGEQRLTRFDKLHPQRLLEEYKLSQEQAILLRASELKVRVKCRAPSTYRYLFRQLKFRRLLFEIKPLSVLGEPLVDQDATSEQAVEEYEITMSGPHNLFRASTKYGLQLALMLPALRVCDQWRLSARVHWGKERTPLDFYLDHESSASTPSSDPLADVELPDEVESLLVQLKKNKTEWRARRSSKIIQLPGVGLCVPDLVLSHPKRRDRVYFEVMGYWSRDAVWKRIELVEAGMSEHIIFAVSSRLRVSERALEDDLPSALLIYKGAILIRRLVELLDRLVPAQDDELTDQKSSKS
jgi:predicted nuclease of restriction endonuclease-like RecB superfamily